MRLSARKSTPTVMPGLTGETAGIKAHRASAAFCRIPTAGFGTEGDEAARQNTPVVMYCNGIKCGRAAKAVKAAIELGYTKVYYYALGMGEWKEKGLPVVSG